MGNSFRPNEGQERMIGIILVHLAQSAAFRSHLLSPETNLYPAPQSTCAPYPDSKQYLPIGASPIGIFYVVFTSGLGSLVTCFEIGIGLNDACGLQDFVGCSNEISCTLRCLYIHWSAAVIVLLTCPDGACACALALCWIIIRDKLIIIWRAALSRS